ncbi:MAG: 50S ribosomal protein L4 [Candidatus Aenigmatarchaeota archaeon]
MKVPVYDMKGSAKGEMTVSKAFSRLHRADVIKRAVLAEQAQKRQPYGADPLAGHRTSAKYIGERSIYGSMMNKEIARKHRITAAGFMHWKARFTPGVVKGRKAHPPKAEKVWTMKINKKERLMALLSAVSCTADRKLIEKRGHALGDVKHLPLVLDDKFQELSKSKEVVEALNALGLEKELERCSGKKTRAGRGKTRGRKTIRKKGPVLIVSEDKGISKAAGAIPGVDVSTVKGLNVSILAPGTQAGRLAVWTKSAVEEVEKLAS